MMNLDEIVKAWQDHCAVVQAAQDELSVLSERQREFLRLVAKGFERGEASRRKARRTIEALRHRARVLVRDSSAGAGGGECS